MSVQKVTRRDFLSASGLTLAGLTLGLPLYGRSGTAEKVRIGVIGTGSRGAGLISLLLKMPGYEVIACCDIQQDNLQKAVSLTGNKAKAYSNHRALLENKQVDAVIIATPLFLHCPMAL